MSRTMFVSLILVILIGGGVAIWAGNRGDANDSQEAISIATPDSVNDTDIGGGAGEASDLPTSAPMDEGTSTPEGNAVVITYTSAGFSPTNITIKQGTTVEFRNDSRGAFWPASDDHPRHTIYPEFDAGKELPAGQTYRFTFDKTGTWGFHDHVNDQFGGTITVE